MNIIRACVCVCLRCTIKTRQLGAKLLANYDIIIYYIRSICTPNISLSGGWPSCVRCRRGGSDTQSSLNSNLPFSIRNSFQNACADKSLINRVPPGAQISLIKNLLQHQQLSSHASIPGAVRSSARCSPPNCSAHYNCAHRRRSPPPLAQQFAATATDTGHEHTGRCRCRRGRRAAFGGGAWLAKCLRMSITEIKCSQLI